MKEGDFVTREGRPLPWLAYGWEKPEPRGIWASGAESWIVIGAPPGDYVLTLIASAPSRRGRLQQIVVERPAEAPLEVAFTKQLWELEPLRVPFRAERNLSVLKLRPAHTQVLGHGDARRLGVFLAALRLQRSTRPGEVAVVLDTELGQIQLAVDTLRAPKTAANFLRYVDAGHYDGGVFHRTVKLDNQPNNEVLIEVIQAGADASRKKQGFGPIAIERTRDTGLRHVDGTLSMARREPDTATSDFFLCIGDQPSLDFGGARNPDGQGFAAFGRVLVGMDVARKIQAAPAEGQRLAPPVRILKARRR
jgi:peptidyl-prolyl cis-trans isomerase A (cyclophilin A)